MAALPKACMTMPELVVSTATACKLPPEAKVTATCLNSASTRQTAYESDARYLDAVDALGSCTSLVMSLWCCALYDVQRKEQESKQGSVSASMLVPLLRPACAKP